ncbi:MAG: hypothetical protein GX113_05100 [Actinobacteria bacterium]|jgi:hypothetical protein|nr:hypothetical protein [Actinomycetota bacterium]
MTYEEACKLLGYATLPLFNRESRELTVSWVRDKTEDDDKPPGPQQANAARARIDEFF